MQSVKESFAKAVKESFAKKLNIIQTNKMAGSTSVG
jgi:hypothetical protein